MSGRYLRTFLQEHRSTLINGEVAARNRRYHDLDFDQLSLHVKQHRDTGRERLRKVQRLTESAKRSKTAHLLAQHRDIWLATQRQLAQAGKRGQRELDEWRCALVLSDKPDGRSFAEELMEMEAALLAERENLERDSVKLVWTLRTELKKWLAPSRCDNSPIPSRAILDELGAVQLQLVAMATVLDHAYRECCSGLEHVRGMSPPSFLDCDGGVVPLDVQSLAWPNQESLEAIKVEFQALDERYRRSVAELESRFSHVLSSLHGGWSELDAAKFTFVMEQYPSSAPGQRALRMDRLMRELPHKSRDDIVAHETWYSHQLLHQEQHRAVLSSWATHREELAARARKVFEEVTKDTQLARAVASEKKEWAEYCQQLHRELAQWRENRLEMLDREMEAAARAQVEVEAARKLEEEKERVQRDRQKKKLEEYQHKKLIEMDEAQKKERQIQEAANAQQAELALHHLDRVRHREALRALKDIQQREAEERAGRAQEEQEKKLELLRQTVRVEAPSDPLRLLRETKVSLARAVGKEQVALQQPLFPLHGYTAEVVMADPRVKLEHALREAGLHTTSYARQIMSNAAPPHPPRRDQFSTVFK
ncbi:hypothetical protein EMCRGX_G012641 [Ephydatia muelleri]